ncbi:MAG TPA: hypothetical protein VF695_07255 [Sphingomonas sp.]|jgi:hypothetical protein
MKTHDAKTSYWFTVNPIHQMPGFGLCAWTLSPLSLRRVCDNDPFSRSSTRDNDPITVFFRVHDCKNMCRADHVAPATLFACCQDMNSVDAQIEQSGGIGVILPWLRNIGAWSILSGVSVAVAPTAAGSLARLKEQSARVPPVALGRRPMLNTARERVAKTRAQPGRSEASVTALWKRRLTTRAAWLDRR